MAGRRLTKAEEKMDMARSISARMRRASFANFAFRLKAAAAAGALMVSSACATNINNADPDYPMGQPKAAEHELPPKFRAPVHAQAKEAFAAKETAPRPPEQQAARSAQEQAQLAIQRFVEFITTGNQQKADEFLRIYDEETLGEEQRAEEFSQAFMAEFRVRVRDDPEIGPIFGAFWRTRPVEGGVDLSEFAQAIRRVHEASVSGNTRELDALRQQFSAGFVDGLVARWQSAPAPAGPAEAQAGVGLAVPTRTESQAQIDSRRAAELFARAIRAGSEADSEGRTRQYYEEQLTALFTRYRSGNALDDAFLSGFMRSLGDMERAVVDEFMHRERTETLTFPDIERLIRDIRIVARELRAPEHAVNMANLARAYGSRFVSALQRIIAPPRVMALATIGDLRAKIAAIRDFATSRGMNADELSIGGRTLAEWEGQVAECELAGAGASQQRINDINAALPSTDMLAREEREARRIAERFAVIINGTRPFFYNIGEGWLSAARALLSQVDDRRARGPTGPMFSLLLARELERAGLRLDDTTERDSEGRTTLASGIRTTIERVANVLPVLRSARTMLNGDFQQEEADRVHRMINELPAELFDEDTREAMAAGFESAARRSEEARYSPSSINAAASVIRASLSGLPAEMQDRILLGTVSSWHYDVGGAEEGAPRMDALEAAYRHIAGPAFRGFQSWVDRFSQTLQTEAEAAPAGMEERRMFEGVMLRDTRTRLMNAREIFGNTPLEVRFALFELAESRLLAGEGGEISSADAERLAAIVNSLSGLPTAYAALLVRSAGPTLLADYDAQSIELILGAVNTYSLPLINAGMYRELEEYYSGLGDRIRDLFVDVVALRNVGREQSGYLRDVRVRLPPDRPEFADIYLPASRLVISLPKRIYERWVSQGMVVQLSQAPDITQGPALAPSISEIERDFFGRDAISIEMNIPLPMLYLPLVVENLGELRPRYPIPVEEMNELYGEAAGAVHYTTGPDQDTIAYSFSEAVGMRGGGRNWSESVYGRGSDGIDHVVGNVRWDNQPFATDEQGRSTYLTRGRFDLDVMGTELETLRLAFDGVAPSGTDTAVFFEKEGDQYTAYVFQRFAGGSFGLVDARTLTIDEARMFYDHTFAEQPYRLYGATRISGGDAGGAREDWMVQMDGAVLFAGMPSSDTGFQGTGAAVQVGRGAGAADYEHTRGQRTAGLGAYINPEERDYYVGRIYLSNMEQSAERPGIGVHGEFEYFRARRGRIDMFLGSRRLGAEGLGPEDIDAGLIASYLGEGWWGGMRGGYMLSEMIRPQAEGVVPPLAVVTERAAGGTAYGGADLQALSFAAAVSAVWTQLQEERPEGVSEEEWQRHIAAAMRIYIPAIRTRLAGAGVNDQRYWTGGYGIVSVLYPLEWMPEINAFGIYLQGEGEHAGETIPIAGGTAEIAAGERARFRVQAFGVIDEGGGADLRAFFGQQAGFDFSVNGIYTGEVGTIGQGISGALRLRLGDEEDEYRLRVIAAGGYAQQIVGDEEITTIEGGGGIRLNVAEPGQEPTVTDVHVGVSGIHTEVVPISPAEEERSADQVDAQVGVTVGTTDWSLDTAAGVQWWDSGDRERLYVTAGGAYQLWSGEGVFQSISVVGRFAGLVWGTDTAEVGDFNFSVYLRALNY